MKKKIPTAEWILVGVIALAMSTTNLLHVILEWFKNPADRYFVGIAHFFTDFFLYAAQMKQGAMGSLLYYHRFTNEFVPPTWIYWFNNLLGFVGRSLGLSPFATYDISLFILVIGCIFLFYHFLITLYPTHIKKRMIALLFILTASPLFLFGTPRDLWFSPSLAFNRIGGVPHQVFQTILLLLLTMYFVRLLNPSTNNRSFSRIGKLVGLAILAALAASANPIQMLIFILAASVTTGILFMRHKDFRVAIPLLVLLSVSFPSAWLTNKQFDSPVFAVGKVWEAAQSVNRSLTAVLMSIGPIVLFIPFGIMPFCRKFQPLYTLTVSYTAISFILFFSPIPAILTTTPVRYLHPASYILLPILAVEGIFALGDMGWCRLMWINTRIRISILILLYTLLTIPSFTHELLTRITPATNPGVLMDTEYNHVPMPVVEALIWLGHQPTDPNHPVVLVDSNKRIEILVPAFADKTVFSGHPVHTLDPEVKEKLRQDFFGGVMTMYQQEQFLVDHRIGYIITATNRALSSLPSFNLTQVYKNTAVAIYKYGNDKSTNE